MVTNLTQCGFIEVSPYPASIDDLLPGDILVVDDGNDNQHAMLYAGNGEIIQAHSNYNSESGGTGSGLPFINADIFS